MLPVPIAVSSDYSDSEQEPSGDMEQTPRVTWQHPPEGTPPGPGHEQSGTVSPPSQPCQPKD